MRKFGMGDKVEWCGKKGYVVDIEYGDKSVAVEFFSDHMIKWFTEDGRSKLYYKKASLRLVERKK